MARSPSNLRALRTIYRDRADSPRATDVSFTVYAALLAILVVGIPVTRTLVVLASTPSVLSLFHAVEAERIVSVACGVILVIVVGMGSVRGPVLLSPFFVTLLADTAIPRSRALSRTFANTSFLFVGGFLFVGIVLSAVRVFGGGLGILSGIEFVAACLLIAVLACVLWLSGQGLGRHAWVASACLAFAVLGSVLVGPALRFTPWGWLGAVWTGDPALSRIALGALTALALGSLLFVPKMLNSLSRESLLQQAQRWQAASIAGTTGDLATALGRFRITPRVGRRWKAFGRGATWIRVLRSDFVGALRTPGRFLSGLVTVTAAFALLTISVSPSPATVTGQGVAWILGAAAAGAAYIGAGVFVDGFRHAAVSAGVPPLHPYSPTQHYVLRLTFPLALTVSLAAAGFGIGWAFGAPAHAIVVDLMVVLLVVLARAFESVKGPPPLFLLTTPIPSPAGDPMILFLLAWQVDALLIVSASAAVIVLLFSVGAIVSSIITAVIVAVVLLALTRRRLKAA